MIQDYRNLPGKHCGSTAMRNLLFHYCGLELSEEMVFGLGSGLDFLFIRQQEQEPSLAIFGRGMTLEVDVASALDVDYREQPEPDDEEAWLQVRNEVMMERPTMLSGDAFYLDYRGFDVHFPAHRFVLLGFDDEKGQAYVADRLEEVPQTCSLEALRKSRNPKDFISTFNLWGKFHGKSAGRPLQDACLKALRRNARRMLGEDKSGIQMLQALAAGRPFQASVGLTGLEEFSEALPGLMDLPDRKAVAEYAAGCIQKFGTGGGNFRLMYAEFLRQVHKLAPDRVGPHLPALAERSAAGWTGLAGHFAELAQSTAEPGGILEACSQSLFTIIEAECELFEGLAEGV